MINWEDSYHQKEQRDRSYCKFAKLLTDKTDWIGTESHFWTKGCFFYMQCHFLRQNIQFYFEIFHSFFHSFILCIFCSCFNVYASLWIDIIELHQFRDVNNFPILIFLKLKSIFNGICLMQLILLEELSLNLKVFLK